MLISNGLSLLALASHIQALKTGERPRRILEDLQGDHTSARVEKRQSGLPSKAEVVAAICASIDDVFTIQQCSKTLRAKVDDSRRRVCASASADFQSCLKSANACARQQIALNRCFNTTLEAFADCEPNTPQLLGTVIDCVDDRLNLPLSSASVSLPTKSITTPYVTSVPYLTGSSVTYRITTIFPPGSNSSSITSGPGPISRSSSSDLGTGSLTNSVGPIITNTPIFSNSSTTTRSFSSGLRSGGFNTTTARNTTTSSTTIASSSSGARSGTFTAPFPIGNATATGSNGPTGGPGTGQPTRQSTRQSTRSTGAQGTRSGTFSTTSSSFSGGATQTGSRSNTAGGTKSSKGNGAGPGTTATGNRDPGRPSHSIGATFTSGDEVCTVKTTVYRIG